MSISKVSIFPKSLNQVLYRILFKFGTKLISDNFYVSVAEWFLFLYLKYWYFRSLKHFWDCDFNFVNVLELHQSMINDINKRVLIWHFSFNQNKLWTNWRWKQGSFIQQTQYFIPVEIELSSYRHAWESLIFSLVPSENRNTRSTCLMSVFTGTGQTLMSRTAILIIVEFGVLARN